MTCPVGCSTKHIPELLMIVKAERKTLIAETAKDAGHPFPEIDAVKSNFFARKRPSRFRTCKPLLEILEDRQLLSASWPEFALNPQHTALSTVASQPLQAIRWQTPV